MVQNSKDKDCNMSGSEHIDVVYQEHYAHSRHQELQRTGFATILGAILAAIISQYHNLPTQNDLRLSVFAAGWILSFIGFLLMYSWSRPFFRHYILAEVILVKYLKFESLARISEEKWNADNWHFREIFLSLSSRNLFYMMTALFTLIFSVLLGYAITDDAKTDAPISFQIDSFFPGKSEIYLFSILTLVVLLICRIWFALEELYAVRDILSKAKLKQFKDNIPSGVGE